MPANSSAVKKGMLRSDFEGFRYRIIKDKWSTDNQAETNMLLKTEFENIGVGFKAIGNDLRNIIGVVNDVYGSPKQVQEDLDEKVRVNEFDLKAEHLEKKLVEGFGITLDSFDKLNDQGLAIRISISPLMTFYCVIHHFNTHNRTPQEATLEESFSHPIPNRYYLMQVDRPLETDESNVPHYHAGTTKELGAYPIRWETYEKKPFEFRIRFLRPEFGTIILIGAGAVQPR